MKNELLRNIAKLFSANAIAGVVGFAFYPILTRLYTPDNFGLLTLFTSIVGVLTILATADFQYAILLPKDDRQANGITHVALISTAIVVCITLLFTLLAEPIAGLFKASQLAEIWWLIPLMVLICAVWNIANYNLTRNKSFNYVSAYLLTQGTLIPTLKLAFALLGLTAFGLIYGSVAGAAVAVTAVIIIALANGTINISKSTQDERHHIVKEYHRFPAFSLPRSVINNLSANIPALLLTPFFGLTPMGLFAIGLTFSFRPVNMLENSVYQVYFQEVSKAVNSRQTIMPSIRKFIRYTAFIIAPFTIICLMLLSYAMGWILGDKWIETGLYLRLLLPWHTASLFVAPICFLSDIFQKQPQALGFEILIIVCRIIGMLTGILTDSFTTAILGYSLGSTLAIAAQFLWYLSLARNYDKRL